MPKLVILSAQFSSVFPNHISRQNAQTIFKRGVNVGSHRWVCCWMRRKRKGILNNYPAELYDHHFTELPFVVHLLFIYDCCYVHDFLWFPWSMRGHRNCGSHRILGCNGTLWLGNACLLDLPYGNCQPDDVAFTMPNANCYVFM
jgi:hypothetical protein